jgi:regulatory protein
MVGRKRRRDGAGRPVEDKPAPSSLPADEQRALCREAALRLLSAADRPAAQLRERLARKGFSGWIVAEVVERLRETGLVNDERFAAQFAESAAARGNAARRIQMDLARKGVEAEPAARAATTHPDEEEARALRLAAKRAAQMSALPREVRWRRLTGLLARRGFAPDVCRKAVEHALGESSDDPIALD